MTQCPICNFECPDDAHKCECCDYELSTPEKETSSSCANQATPEMANSKEQPQLEDDDNKPFFSKICLFIGLLLIMLGVILPLGERYNRRQILRQIHRSNSIEAKITGTQLSTSEIESLRRESRSSYQQQIRLQDHGRRMMLWGVILAVISLTRMYFYLLRELENIQKKMHNNRLHPTGRS
jgi:hypothetical protein